MDNDYSLLAGDPGKFQSRGKQTRQRTAGLVAQRPLF